MKREPRTKLDMVLTARGRGSGKALAVRIGKTASYICDIRMGRTTPSMHVALAISKDTGIPIADLIARKQEAA